MLKRSLQQTSLADTVEAMFMHPKNHRFGIGDSAKLRVCESEHWDVTIEKRTRFLWWLPSYTVRVHDLDGGYILPGVLDCALRKA